MKTKGMPSVRAAKMAIAANNRVASEIRRGIYLPAITHSLVFKAFMAGYRHGRKMAGKASR